MWTAAFWKAAAERALKSAAQGLIVFWAVGDGVLNVWAINWKDSAGIAGGMILISLLTSVASSISPFGSGGPSLTKAETLDQTQA